LTASRVGQLQARIAVGQPGGRFCWLASLRRPRRPANERSRSVCSDSLGPPWPQPAPYLSGLLIRNRPTVIELDDSNYAVDVLNCVPAHRLHILSLLDDNLR
jgi:hypothetical protein